MDVFPLNLVFTVALAAAMIFLGFLPTRNIGSPFFARQTLNVLIAWIFIALVSPPSIQHYYFFIALLSFGSWWQFRRDRALGGKMWLSIASGLGISIGVMLMLAVTPRAYPVDLPDLNRTLLLASIYLGGAVIGLACVGYILIQGLSASSGITSEQIQRYVGLLPILTLARAGVLLGLVFFRHLFPGNTTQIETWLLLGLVVIIIPLLSFAVQRTLHLRSLNQASKTLTGICVLGFLAEILARLLIL